MFFTVALCGEAGELANVVKKAVRNGATKERLAQIREELADVLIYFCKILDIVQGDFDAAWDYKHKVLATTRRERLGDYTIKNKRIRREDDDDYGDGEEVARGL